MHTSRYQIIVSGSLGVVGRAAFRDFHIEPHGMDTAPTLAPEPHTRLAQ
jgi:hypothetical protein